MKLTDFLIERPVEDAEKTINNLKGKLTDINAEINKLKSKGATVANAVVAPQYKAQYDKLVAAKKDIQEKIKIERERAGSSEKGREWEKGQKEKHDNPEEMKQRRSAAMSSGMKSGSELRKKHGGWEGLAKFIKGKVHNMTSGGHEKLHVDQIEKLSDSIGVTARTLYKWMERPEFREVRRVLPREW